MAFIQIATIRIKEGKMEEAKVALRKALSIIKELEPGTLEYIPYTVKGEPEVIIIFEKYADKDALKAHVGNFGKTMLEFGPCCAPGRPEIQILEEI